ncbi:MAG: MoaD/ThiS family protein [Candidatus Caldarchaeum sp.]
MCAEAVVKIIFVGPLRTAFGSRELTLAAREGESVRQLLVRVASGAGGRGVEYLLDENPEQLVVSVDGEVVRDLDRKLRGGETIILTPALSGGSSYSVRCLNCSARIPVQQGVSEATCNSCGTSYTITWISPTQPKIRRVV